MAGKNNLARKGDDTKINEPRRLQRAKKLKELWSQAIRRMIKKIGNVERNPSDQELGTWSLGVHFRDELFKQQLQEEGFAEEYPLGSSFEVLDWDKLLAHLRSEL